MNAYARCFCTQIYIRQNVQYAAPCVCVYMDVGVLVCLCGFRFDCLYRVYKYFFSLTGLDLQKMQKAASRFVGQQIKAVATSKFKLSPQHFLSQH